MLTDEIKARIAAATVRIFLEDGAEGRGVLVPGGFLLTAAHCVNDRTNSGVMAYDEMYFNQEIETREGVRFKVSPRALEPIADIAVMASCDREEYPDDADAFDSFCEQIPPVRICESPLTLWEPVCVQLLQRTGDWITGRARLTGGRGRLHIEYDELPLPGSSGSAVVNDQGELIALHSTHQGERPTGEWWGAEAYPRLALPVWVWEKIREAQEPEFQES